ncbi:outer membrane cobalamin receptor protein [Saccharicrinis fermentans DSM 9555 = JCM 21142]|uniref:Outer membrane cobalamin receptor protein n=1 Tax=Saccharicrinis fermentans DSM 9555 = JCM 21142 TaxID=869213 RepID=W7YLM6_9BACT|nr:SusC/RagA family TonB-linked outer membrane protein [Saccharicrinis fermentans]GAF05501.1 outer membrane cobalamin receptor protein [Saccharicrinis fermentans DSM 9555 = JCM 21142]
MVDADTREPLVGVAVMLSGTTTGTITDMNGEYFLDVYPTSTITTSYISYDEQVVKLEGRTKLDIALEPTVNGLSEVVVVGYASQNRKDVTGAVDVINADSFNEGVMSNAEQLFQGKISGVRVLNSSGEPGAGVDVMIRGAGSIRSGNTPLFVIDGMPLTNENVSPGGIDEGIGSSRSKNPLNFLNPSDIESVSVLKDASAAAIYGARGSNGVVLITTKKGDKGKSRFTLDSYRGVSNVAKKLDLLTGSEYATVNPDQMYAQDVSTDWQEALFRSAITTSNNLSFSNNTETNHYYMSISHLHQEGIIEENSFERLSGRFNVKQSFFDDDRLTISSNITASNTKDVGVPTSDNTSATGELITHMLKANPTRPVYDENGDLFDFDTEGSYNPLYMLDFYDDQTQTLRVLGNFELSLKLFKGLVYRLTYGVDKSNSERNTTYYPNTSEIESDGAYYQQNYDMYNYLIEHYMTYNLVKGAHKLRGLGGFSYQRFKRTGTTFGFIGFEDNGVNPAHNPSGGRTQLEGDGFAEINELQSYFGRINYSFKDKYLLTASLRADGSTRFGKNNKYGYFPSFALGWNLSQEKFMRSIEAINNMKIRASWGQTGNQEVPNKVTKETYSEQASTGYYMYGQDQAIVNGITFTRTANDDLKWEVVSQLNVGLDYSLFNNKLYGSVDYYNKTTTDAILLIPSTQPNISDVWTNIDGEIVNRGIEFSLGSRLVRKKDFSWTIDLNGATLKNEVKNLPLSEILTGRVSGSGVTGETVNIYKNGYSAGSFYLRHHEGFDDNGISIVSDEKQITESALPTFTYGVSNVLNYKNVDLSFSLVGQSGAYLFNNTKLATSVMSNLLASKNVTKDVLNSGQSANDAIVVSDYYLEKSDYLKLSNLQLGYSFNTEKINWLSEARVYATGQNLWTWTDYSGFDPSVNTTKNVGGNSSLGMDYASYPSAKTILFGITIKY